MAAFFIDMDDTIVSHGTNDLLDGALDSLKRIKAGGHQLFITTRRGDDWPAHHVYGRQLTERFLRGLGVDIDGVVYNVDSPRIVINDGGAVGINHPPRTPFTYEFSAAGKLLRRKKPA